MEIPRFRLISVFELDGMKKGKLLKWILKILSAMVSFAVLFYLFQIFLTPHYLTDATVIVKGYDYLEKDSLDVVFLGTSQMFCTVDSGKLTRDYGISSYNFGGSSQSMGITSYYFDEALKTQNPKVIMVEVFKTFNYNSEVNDEQISWNYSPMKMSFDKFWSLYTVSNGDTLKSFEHTFAPLLAYHSRWTSVNDADSDGENDIDFVLHPEKYIDFSSRGFVARDHYKTFQLTYAESDTTLRSIPDENKKAMLHIAEECQKRNIKLIFFKSPLTFWTRGDSLSVKQFMNENQLSFVDLNDYLEEIGIDGETDFNDKWHVCESGAEKVTAFLADRILKDIV